MNDITRLQLGLQPIQHSPYDMFKRQNVPGQYSPIPQIGISPQLPGLPAYSAQQTIPQWQGVEPLNTNGGMTVGTPVQGLGGAPAQSGGMWDSVKNFFGSNGGDYLRDANGQVMMHTNPTTGASTPIVDPNAITTGDMWTGIGAAAQTALGAYGMFADIGYKKDLINNQRDELRFAREQFEEKLRHNRAIVSQNRGA